jgi:hypothetical protein
MPETNRRKFLQRAGAFSATAFLSSLTQPAWSRNLQSALRNAEGISPTDLATEEDFWYYIQQSFTVSPSLINLNNGGVSPAPKTVQDAMKRYYDYCNEAPSYYMWRILDQGREPQKKFGKACRLFRRRNSHQQKFVRRIGDSDIWFAIKSR